MKLARKRLALRQGERFDFEISLIKSSPICSLAKQSLIPFTDWLPHLPLQLPNIGFKNGKEFE